MDPGTWEVCALEVRSSWLAPVFATLDLASLRGAGDVLLVQDATSLEPQEAWSPQAVGCHPLVGADVVTQAGEFLGKVRDFQLDVPSGRITALRLDAFGVPFLPVRARARARECATHAKDSALGVFASRPPHPHGHPLLSHASYCAIPSGEPGVGV